MTTSPVKPDGSFSDVMAGLSASNMSAEPAASVLNSFKLQLNQGNTKLGWLAVTRDWAFLTADPAQAVDLEKVLGDGGVYYKMQGHSRYLSVSDTGALGFYLWNGRTTFKTEGSHLVSNHNGQKLSQYSTSDTYLYARDDYTVLDVSEVA